MANDRVGVGGVTSLASWLDRRLRERFGRPYRAILSVGLMISIVGTAESLTKALATKQVVSLVATVVFEAALLVNQLAQMHEYRQERIARREARTSEPAARD